MEHLTKQQIVLLTLLVSFVTSLSTGIVTVSLMDQAPAATHTISQVIEKTIQQVAPQNAAVGVVSISVDDQIASATASMESSIIRIKNMNTNSIVGLGVPISHNSNIQFITDSSIISQNQSYAAVLEDNSFIPLSLVPQVNLNVQSSTSIAVFQPTNAISASSQQVLNPVTLSGSYKLGQKIFSLTGTSSHELGDGLITGLGVDTINTSISTIHMVPGSPLYDITGNVIGLWASLSQDKSSNGFTPIAPSLISAQ